MHPCEIKKGPFYRIPCLLWHKVLFRWELNAAGENSYLCKYDSYSPMHNVFDACISITWARGRGWALKWQSPIGSMPFHRAQKTLDFQCSTPSQVMDRYASKTLCTGLYKSQVHRWFYVQEPTRKVSGPILWRSRCIKEFNRPAWAASPHYKTYQKSRGNCKGT